MRLSAFNLYVDDHPAPGQILVYNTFTGGFVTLEPDELALLRRADAGAILSDIEQAAIDREYFAADVGILVESRESEERAWRAWYEAVRMRDRRLSAIVSVTFACNLDCTYCCQSDVLDGRTMTEATADRVAAWLVTRAREAHLDGIHLAFVGGEPLLHPGRIERVLAGVRARTDLPLTFSLITNGVFLTRDLVERWLPLGLTHAQVTLDGDASTHAITRRSKQRGDDSFATIFANVIAVSDILRVQIKGNYQRDTVHGFVPLLDQLRAAGLPSGSRVSFTPALEALDAPSYSASGACTLSASSPHLMIALGDEILRRGFTPSDPMTLGPCGFHLRDNFAIDPEGRIYKCPGFLGHAEFAVGDVATGLDARYDAMVAHDVQSSCGDCSHRPSCAGGCVAAEWVKRGRAEGVNCEKDLFERYQTPLIERKYALAVSDTIDEALARVSPVEEMRFDPVRRVGGTVSLRVLAA